MDCSQTAGDIANASSLNDGQLLFTSLGNYLYGFVFCSSVGSLDMWFLLVFLRRNAQEEELQIRGSRSEVMQGLLLNSNKHIPLCVV